MSFGLIKRRRRRTGPQTTGRDSSAGSMPVVRNSADDRIAGEWQAYRLNEIEVFVNQWHRTIVILSIAAAIFILLFILALAGRAMGGG